MIHDGINRGCEGGKRGYDGINCGCDGGKRGRDR